MVTAFTRLLCSLGVVAAIGCKKEETCKPGEVQWGVQLLIEASSMINPDANGEALPTVVRLYQIRGEIVLDNLDFATIWESEDPKDLGDGFLAVEELTIYPGQNDKRLVPIESQATHIVATGWFREPLGNTWYASYEIPRRHPDVVCQKAPESKVYPNPCFYALLDRSAVTGGPTPPAGLEIDGTVQCAPLGVVLGDDHSGKKKKKKKRKKKRKKTGLEDPLKDKNRVDGTRPEVPESPPRKLPPRVLPRKPHVSAPTRPRTPSVPPVGDPR